MPDTATPNTCPNCRSDDPNKVGVERATGKECRDPFHCPTPEAHGNPFRYCPNCNWVEPQPQPEHWTPDEIIAECGRMLIGGGNPKNMHANLMTAIGMIESLAWLAKPRDERDRENNPPPTTSGE